MLTKGLAACIILDLIPTPENRVLAKKTVDDSCFEVVHTGTKYLDPFPIAKVFAEKNPHKYKTYLDTPPPSPPLVPTPSPPPSPPLVPTPSSSPSPSSPLPVLKFKQPELKTDSNPRGSIPRDKYKANNKSVGRFIRKKNTIMDNQIASNNATPRESKPSSKPRNLITALRDNQSIIMQITKALFMRTYDCESTHHLVYATDQFMYDVLDKHIPISRIWTVSDFVKALKDNEDYFQDYDQVISMQNVRVLYMVKENQQSRIVKKVLFDSIPNLCTYF